MSPRKLLWKPRRRIASAMVLDPMMKPYHSGDYKRAFEVAESLRQSGKVSASCCFYRGSMLAQLGRLGEAERWLRRSIDLEDRTKKRSLAITFSALGDTLLQARRYGEAEKCLRRSIRLFPGRSPAYRGMAELCLMRGDGTAAAVRWANLALERQKADQAASSELRRLNLGESLAALAWATAAESRSAPAVARLVARALKSVGTGTVESTALVHHHSGCAYRELGDMLASAKHYEEAARIDAQGKWGRAAREALRGAEHRFKTRMRSAAPGCLRQHGEQAPSASELRQKLDGMGLGRLAKPIATQCRPSLRLTAGRPCAQAVSRLGGRPNLPKDVRWPLWEEQPLSFVAQLDLGALPSLRGLPLPRSGSLFFFYDADNSPWGFDPKDRGCARVIYSRNPLAGNPLRAPHRDLDEEVRFRSAALAATPEVALPNANCSVFRELGATEKELRAYLELTDPLRGPIHRIGGHPDEIQGDVLLEAQLASNGVYCGSTRGYVQGRKTGLAAGVADWRLLLQVDSENRIGMDWGDSGRIYFLIREDDLRHRDFDHVWLILQCT